MTLTEEEQAVIMGQSTPEQQTSKDVPDKLQTDSAISLVDTDNNSQVTGDSVSEEPTFDESNNDTKPTFSDDDHENSPAAEHQLVVPVVEEEKESVTKPEQEKPVVEDNEIKTTNKNEEKPSVEETDVNHNNNNSGVESSKVDIVTAAATNEEKMTIQRTLAIIKPDAVSANKKDDIVAKIKEAEFTIVQERQLHLSLEQARLFYREHEGKDFYDELTQWMSSGPIYALILEKVNAIQDWRAKMGPTDPVKARDIDSNSIRALFGTDGMVNATHGSDCQTSAEREIQIIFETIDEQKQENMVDDKKEIKDEQPTEEDKDQPTAAIDQRHLIAEKESVDQAVQEQGEIKIESSTVAKKEEKETDIAIQLQEKSEPLTQKATIIDETITTEEKKQDDKCLKEEAHQVVDNAEVPSSITEKEGEKEKEEHKEPTAVKQTDEQKPTTPIANEHEEEKKNDYLIPVVAFSDVSTQNDIVDSESKKDHREPDQAISTTLEEPAAAAATEENEEERQSTKKALTVKQEREEINEEAQQNTEDVTEANHEKTTNIEHDDVIGLKDDENQTLDEPMRDEMGLESDNITSTTEEEDLKREEVSKELEAEELNNSMPPADEKCDTKGECTAIVEDVKVDQKDNVDKIDDSEAEKIIEQKEESNVKDMETGAAQQRKKEEDTQASEDVVGINEESTAAVSAETEQKNELIDKELADETISVTATANRDQERMSIPKEESNKETKVDAPKEEVAKVETPKEEVEKVEAPKEEVAQVEAPKEEAEKAETPKEVVTQTETPKEEVEKVETSKEEVEKVEAPKKEAAKIEAPKEEAEKAETPKEVVTQTETPKEEVEKVETSKEEVEKVETPKKEAAQVETPKEEATNIETPKEEDTKTETTKEEATNIETPKEEDRKTETPEKDSAKIEEAKVEKLKEDPEKVSKVASGKLAKKDIKSTKASETTAAGATKPKSPSRSPQRKTATASGTAKTTGITATKKSSLPERKTMIATRTATAATTGTKRTGIATTTATPTKGKVTTATTTTTTTTTGGKVPRVATLAKKQHTASRTDSPSAENKTPPKTPRTSVFSRLSAPTSATRTRTRSNDSEEGKTAVKTTTTGATTKTTTSARTTAVKRTSVGGTTTTTPAARRTTAATKTTGTAKTTTTTAGKTTTRATSNATTNTATGTTPAKRVVRKAAATTTTETGAKKTTANGTTPVTKRVATSKVSTTSGPVKRNTGPATSATTLKKTSVASKKTANTTASGKSKVSMDKSGKESTTNDEPEAQVTVAEEENPIVLKGSNISEESSGITESEEDGNAAENRDDVVEEKEDNSASNDTMEDVTKQVLGESSVDHDDEVAAITTVHHDGIKTAESLSVMDGKISAGSASSRPKTPEVAQLRNKFESNTLSAADGVNDKNDHTKEARARSPSNRVKDMINRFTA